jgi:hypothetical protein
MINHKKKVIQIHIPKSAGKSIAKFLNLTEYPKGFDGLHYKPEVVEDIWYKYFTFTFVRNPWDRVLSGYLHCRYGLTEEDKKKKKFYYVINKHSKDFTDFVKRFLSKSMKTTRFCKQSDFLTNKYNFIGRYERLEKDLKKICSLLDIPIEISVPVVNKIVDHDPYTDFYDLECSQIVAELYKEDIENLGYSFNNFHDDSLKKFLRK